MSISTSLQVVCAALGLICFILLVLSNLNGKRQIDVAAEWFVPQATIALYLAAIAAAILALMRR